ncbi:UDP-glucose 4-epimerase GalE [Lichtheimia ornata]|uniref:UDP-glucose 4-epimerase n=1 Tax=Lichtheimia ornata TaxID=688661 RepID=A0AAD7UZC9_9FUNG|nr:UDP-glucose 4-epimerase GalE [Lichtheimia ornata]KAJ8654881.1 UDP-glucose 4-epimerase GalE [Lichtheimia ornata]
MPGNKILVTGGSGYIGSHTIIELLNEGYEVVAIDNLRNSSYEAIRRIEQITGKKVTFYKVDLLDKKALQQVFQRQSIWAVIHFAGLKAVGESTKIPLDYFHDNITGSILLMKAMKEAGVKNIVFSSSATVYGEPKVVPIPETSPTGAKNPYGHTKETIEHLIEDVCESDKEWNGALLRYFNPVGAHPSGNIGENPLGIPNNLMPFLAQVAIGRREYLSIFGNDYDTPDGTCIRDYIDVVDLAKGHIAALKKLQKDPHIGCIAYNLGTGRGQSVLDMVHAFSKAVGHELPYKLVGRRAGDVPRLVADAEKANKELGWKATKTLEETCASLWNWQTKNPKGLEDCPGDAPPESIISYL